MILTCPVRGEITSNNKALEEQQRIELVKILLQKGYEKNDIKFEEPIKLGNGGRNSIRADVTVYEDSKLKIVCEVKKNKSDRDSAIQNQLIPYMRNKKVRIGVYYDGETNAVILDDDRILERPLSVLPAKKENELKNSVYFDDLMKIHEISTFLDNIDQLLHNNAINKTERQNIINSILFIKYFDETQSKAEKTRDLICTTQSSFDDIETLLEEAIIYFKSKIKKIDIKKFNKKHKEVVIKIINAIQDYSIIKTGVNFIQSYFMKFGSTMLKTNHDQYYTPYEIVSFATSLFNYESTNKIIDPAAGTGDFLTAAKEQAQKQGVTFLKNNIHYMDISSEALNLGVLNLTLAGVDTKNFHEKDSIKSFTSLNNEFDYVFTNPPFGIKTTYSGPLDDLLKYELKTKYNAKQHNQLGILFIEKSMRLLKDNGFCTIVLPSGYMSNPSNNKLREYIFDNFRLIAVIGLPAGTFKDAKTDVKTDLVIIQKTKMNSSYNIFMDEAQKIGFNYTKKSLDKLYKRNDLTGAFLIEDNERVSDTDLPDIAIKFRAFANANNISELKTNFDFSHIDFNAVCVDDIKPTYEIKPDRYIKRNVEMLERLQAYVSQGKALLIGDSDWDIQSADTDLCIDKSKMYSYIPIGSAGKSYYKTDNYIRGWDLPGRAKQLTREGDIFISRLEGSSFTFFMTTKQDEENVIVTNGMFKVRIKNEIERLSLFKYLFNEEFWIQQRLATNGAIMATAGEKEFKKIIVPLIDESELNEARKLLKLSRKFNSVLNNL